MVITLGSVESGRNNKDEGRRQMADNIMEQEERPSVEQLWEKAMVAALASWATAGAHVSSCALRLPVE
jgi:hypothetical protein